MPFTAKSLSILVVALSAFAASAPCQAGFLFDFNTLAAGVNSATGADPIETYMEGVYGSDIAVALGAKTLKEKPEAVGPTNFLGNTDNGVYHVNPKDTYLINRWNSTTVPTNLRDRITIEFLAAPVSFIEFDWQIFPVTTGKADITVKADGVTIFYYDNDNTQAEKEAGKMGHFSWFSPGGTPVTKFEFIDWTTAPIGIDNLNVDREQRLPPVPEPTGIVLWSSLMGVSALVTAYRRRRTAE